MRVAFSSVKVSSPWGPAGPSEPQEGEAGPPEYRRSPLCSSTVSEALSIPSSSLRGAIDVPWGGLVTTAPPRTEWPQRSSCGAASPPPPTVEARVRAPAGYHCSIHVGTQGASCGMTSVKQQPDVSSVQRRRLNSTNTAFQQLLCCERCEDAGCRLNRAGEGVLWTPVRSDDRACCSHTP